MGSIVPLLVLINCKDQIDPRGEANTGVLMMDGKVTTFPGFNKDEDAGTSEAFVESGQGIYLAQGHVVPGIAGHRYHVEVTLAEGNKYATRNDNTKITSPD